jgi:hypothetical protein
VAEAISAAFTATWVTKADHSVWMYGLGGGIGTVNRQRDMLPAVFPPTRQDWIPPDTAALDARSDAVCIIGSDHRLTCQGTPASGRSSYYVADVAQTWASPWDGPIYVGKLDGSVWCCDAGTTTMDSELTDLGHDVVSMAVGWNFACALKKDGAVWCFGAGFLGDGHPEYPETDPQPPRQVTLPAPAVAIAAGLQRTCVALADGSAWCWGAATADFGTSPVQKDITDVKTLSMGAFHTCALKGDGTVWCWGTNKTGETGWGPAGPQSADKWEVPTEVAGLVNDVTSISMGFQHSCARKMDGTVWCWGNSGLGQLGTNEVENTSPKPLRGCEGP